jgi:hypothetical protein
MIRVVLINLLLILTPVILYFAYVYVRRRREPNLQIMENAPIFWLLAAGVGLMLAGLVVLGQWEEGGLEGRYVPPRIEDGRIVPGHFEPLENKRSQNSN